MDRMDLDYEELQYVVHLCRRLSASLDLKHFLTGHLRHRLPALARKIENLNVEQVNMLRTEIDAHDQNIQKAIAPNERLMASGLLPDDLVSDGLEHIPLAFLVANDKIQVLVERLGSQ